MFWGGKPHWSTKRKKKQKQNHIRSVCQEMFCKLAFLKYPQNSQNAETTGLESLYNNAPGLQAVNFIEWTPAQVFSSEFFRIFKSTSEWLFLVFTSKFWETFQDIYFIEHLWELAYFMYKLQDFSKHIQ